VLTLTVLEVLGKLAAGRISIRPPSPLAIFILFVLLFLFPPLLPSRLFVVPCVLSFHFEGREAFVGLKALWQRELSCRSPGRGFCCSSLGC